MAGVDHDQLIIEGIATIAGGSLDLLLFDGFDPVLGDTFDVMLADTINGAFDTINQPSFLGQPLFGVSVVDLFSGNQQALRVTALQTVPEPATLAVLVAGMLVLLSSHRRTRSGGCASAHRNS